MKRFLSALCAWLLIGSPAVAGAPAIPPGAPTQFLPGSSTIAAQTGPYLPSSLGNPYLVCSMRRLVKGYSGPIETVTRSSDSTSINVGFASGTDLQDTASMASFAGSSSLSVSACYDQSGNGYTLTPAFGSSPVTYSDYAENGMWPIGIHNIGGTTVGMANGSLTGLNRNNMTVYMVVSPRSSLLNVFLEFGNSAVTTGYAALYTHQGVDSYATGSTPSGTLSRAQPEVIGWSSGSSGQNFVVHDTPTVSASVISSQSLASIEMGIDLFSSNAATTNEDIEAVIIYPTVHTIAQMQAVSQLLESAFAVPTAFKRTLIYGGSSLIFGNGTGNSPGRTWIPIQQWPSDTQIFNASVGGQSLATEYAGLSANEFTFLQGGMPNIIVTDAPSNDLASAGTAGAGQSIYTNTLAPMVAAIIAQGATPVIPTILERQSLTTAGQPEIERQSYNNLLRAGAPGLGAILSDRAADPIMNNQSNLTNTNWFVDGTHPSSFPNSLTSGGYQRLAPAEALAINARVKVSYSNPLMGTSAAFVAQPHTVSWTATLASGAATVTLTGSAIFTSATSYTCLGNDTSASTAAPVSISNTSASVFAVKGTGGDVVTGMCIGS